jgi:RNA-directed DNA polymerase
MDRVRLRIGDKRVLALVKSFLKAGVMTTAGATEGTITGTPQGGILSPLLANIALSSLDEHFMQQWTTLMFNEQHRQARKRRGQANFRIVRYADDFVVLGTGKREHAEALRTVVADVLTPMGLRLSKEKTRVVHIDDGFDFLGFNIRRMRKRGSQKRYVYTMPSKKAVASIKDRVRTMTYRHTLHHDPGYLMDYLGRVLRGWANYFRHGVSKRTFNAIDSYAWERVTAWLRKKHRIGWPELRRRFCLPGTWRLAHDGQRFRGAATVTVTRYRYRGYRIPTPWTPTGHTA